jgi:hypothetical protein
VGGGVFTENALAGALADRVRLRLGQREVVEQVVGGLRDEDVAAGLERRREPSQASEMRGTPQAAASSSRTDGARVTLSVKRSRA